MNASTVSYVKIFPPIGIARLGNSEGGVFIGPENPGVVPECEGSYKDSAGAIKRQVARFRLYAFDASDQVVCELTADHPDVAEIRWTVTLANKKAEWYQFAGADAISHILSGTGPLPQHRNPGITGADRDGLVIGPVSASVSPGSAPQVLEGKFVVRYGGNSLPSEPVDVYLGEVRIDDDGRLLVLGGRGKSDSVLPDNPLSHYANNDYWYDDTADGPVEVRVTLTSGAELPVRGRAWVIAAPPHYSPHTQNIVTLHDVLTETAIDHALSWPPEFGSRPDISDPVSFTRDIYPILRRLVLYQWVSERASRGHSRGKEGYFLDKDTLEILADPTKVGKGSLHERIVRRIRNPIMHPPLLGARPPREWELNPVSQAAIDQANLFYMPPISGDEGDASHGDPTTWLSLTATQYHKLERWKEGDFVDDRSHASRATYESLGDLPIAEQPAALTLASLEVCQGGGFFPGIEMTSIARYPATFVEAFRLADNLQPGDVTRWMALPWQADFFECRDHWWPSVRPDDVIPVEEYERVFQEFKGEAEQGRLASLLIPRKKWARGLAVAIPSRPGMPRANDGDLVGATASSTLR